MRVPAQGAAVARAIASLTQSGAGRKAAGEPLRSIPLNALGAGSAGRPAMQGLFHSRRDESFKQQLYAQSRNQQYAH